MEQRKNNKIKIFDYIEELDCFKPTKKYSKIAERLSIAEWNPVVWIGRYFTMDNDYGGHWFDNWEHWFDNWDEREGFREKAEKLGYRMDELLILVSERFKDGEDGPVHPSEMRESFWRDVLSSLELSLDTLFEEARYFNAEAKRHDDKAGYISDLEERIERIRVEEEKQ